MEDFTGFLDAGHVDSECRAFAELAFYADVAAVLFDDAVTDREAKSRAFAHLLEVKNGSKALEATS